MQTQGAGGVHAETTDAEREVADLLPIEADRSDCRRVLEEVPFWFHTLALNTELGLYTPGFARDHRYRIPAIPEDFGGLNVLDVGTFDGFYAFLAEHRGAGRVVAVDNEQYRSWVRSRWGIELEGGEGFRAIHSLLESNVEYDLLDAFELDRLEERFDIIYCFGILHRVMDPRRLLEVLRDSLTPGGRVLIETYGMHGAGRDGDRGIQEHPPGEVYKGDAYVYWGFSSRALADLASDADFDSFELLDTPMVDGHPRILGVLSARSGA